MGELSTFITLIQTPFGAVAVSGSLVAGAFFYLARTTSRLADRTLGAVEDRLKKTEEAMVTLTGVVRGNSEEVAKLQLSIKHLRDDLAKVEAELRETKVAITLSDKQRADMITRITSLNLALDRFEERAKAAAATKLVQTPIAGTDKAQLKKTGNDPGGNQGR